MKYHDVLSAEAAVSVRNQMEVRESGGTVLLVDDDPFVINALKRVLRYQPYRLLSAASAAEALETLERTPADVAVLDFWMPGQNGLWLAEVIRERYPGTVQIMLTGCAELSVVQKAATRGVIHRYLLKPWDRDELIKTLAQALESAVGLAREENDTGRDAGINGIIPSPGHWQKLPPSVGEWGERMLELSQAVDCRDPCTLGHSSRVSVLSCWLAERIGLRPAKINDLLLGALLHDVGKVAVPDSILFKSARLTPEEMSSIQSHTMVGWRILLEQGAPEAISGLARHHHEDFNGSGYPDGLVGEDIPLFARIVRLADSFDAMYHKRPYRDALPLDFICKTFRELSGRQFDPALVKLFLDLAQGKEARLLYHR